MTMRMAICVGVLAVVLSPSLSLAQDNKYGWSFIDQRPASENKKRSVPGTSLIVSCNYGISITDDHDQIETRTASLQRALDQKLGSKLIGKTVVLKRYLISFNGSAIGRKETFGDGTSPTDGGPVIAAMSTMGVNCPEEKVPIGWYAKSEVTNGHSPFISIISVEIDGTTFSGRYLTSDLAYPPSSALPGTKVLKQRKQFWVKGVALAIQKTNSSFADKLNAELP